MHSNFSIKHHRYQAYLALTIVTLLFILLFSILLPVHAHQGATGVVKERMELMDDIGDNMKGIKSMIQNKTPYDAALILKHARAISSDSAHINRLFPEGSIHGPSEALPAIWQDWERFKSLSDQVKVEADALADLSQSDQKKSVFRQFAKLGKTCRNCHTDFRKKKKKK